MIDQKLWREQVRKDVMECLEDWKNEGWSLHDVRALPVLASDITEVVMSQLSDRITNLEHENYNLRNEVENQRSERDEARDSVEDLRRQLSDPRPRSGSQVREGGHEGKEGPTDTED